MLTFLLHLATTVTTLMHLDALDN